MTSYPRNSDPDVPSQLPNTLSREESVPPRIPSIPPEHWQQVEVLFDLLMDASDPEAVLQAAPDPVIAAAARRLWQNDQLAAGRNFLDEPITFVRQFVTPSEPSFAAGQTLAGRFVVERMLGSGGMGEVYLAHDDRLNETVALKTIRRDLAADPSVGRRFLAEVRNARRVTNPHVCRINELFDEGSTPFFTMQYLNGIRLTEWLETRLEKDERIRRRIALELAEGLAAAHRAAILHCDFKPANVILTGSPAEPTACITDFGLARAFEQTVPARTAALSLVAGTRSYMAPELLEGAAPSIRSDIYSYGKVFAELLPNHRLAARCAAPRPEDRPETLEPVIQALRGSTRRIWIAGGAAAVAAASAAAYSLASRPSFVLASRQRLAVNGFRPANLRTAFVVRDLLITALRQSPLLMVMADDRIRALLLVLKNQPKLPADTEGLLSAANRESALAVEGALETLGSGLRLTLQVFAPGEARPVLHLAEQVDDPRQVVQLADRAALRLRREFGESAGSLRPGGGYVPLATVTSSSPEAVDLYYRGVTEYNQAHAQAALTWFDEALRIDPDFVLAHMQRGIALASQEELVSALPSYEKAFALRHRLSERERLWIEGRYYNIIRDYVSSLATCRRLVVLFPDEATFQRNVAFAATRIGHSQDALPFSQRAIELDPANDNGLSEWLVNHCDANRYDEALAKFKEFRDAGHTSTLLDCGAGLALTGKGEFEKATQAFVRMGSAPERERWARLLRCIPMIAAGQWTQVASDLSADVAYDTAISEELRQMTRRYWLGMMHTWTDTPWHAVPHLELMSRLDASPAWLPSLREGAMLALEAGEHELASKFLDPLRELERRWPSTNTHGSRALLEGLLLPVDDPKAAALLTEARGLWPDPVTLYYVGRFQNQTGDFESAAATLDMLEEARGRAYRLFFPGLVGLGRVERARSLERMSRFEDAARLYRQVLEDWGDRASRFKIAQNVRSEYRRLISANPKLRGK
jgi:tetratricopeptide (TPR) repeat protein